MLREFEGIIDSSGLTRFRQRGRSGPHDCPTASSQQFVPFWAVLETDSAIKILRELQTGDRGRALRLLEELAFDLGCEWRKEVLETEIYPRV